jgi:hypothetical protein
MRPSSGCCNGLVFVSILIFLSSTTTKRAKRAVLAAAGAGASRGAETREPAGIASLSFRLPCPRSAPSSPHHRSINFRLFHLFLSPFTTTTMSATSTKRAAFSVLSFLEQSVAGGAIKSDDKESIEGARVSPLSLSSATLTLPVYSQSLFNVSRRLSVSLPTLSRTRRLTECPSLSPLSSTPYAGLLLLPFLRASSPPSSHRSPPKNPPHPPRSPPRRRSLPKTRRRLMPPRAKETS